jgi:hypothetical protein
MMRVRLQMSPGAVFQYPIDGVAFDAPDSFRPILGDRVTIDNIRGVDGVMRGLDVYVAAVEWRLMMEDTKSSVWTFDSILVLTVSSDAPPKPRGARVRWEDNLKK